CFCHRLLRTMPFNIVKKNYTGINDNKKGMVRRRRWQKHHPGGTYYLRCATPRKKSKRLLRRSDSYRYGQSIAGSAAVAILRNKRLFASSDLSTRPSTRP